MSRVIHFDFAAVDMDRAIAFCRRAFGWAITKASGPLDYWLIRTGEPDKLGIDGGLARRDADWQRITMLVDVESAKEAARKIEKAGDRIVRARTFIPGVGYVIACDDTEQNVLAIIEQDETAGF